jgi:hypothetical protein
MLGILALESFWLKLSIRWALLRSKNSRDYGNFNVFALLSFLGYAFVIQVDVKWKEGEGHDEISFEKDVFLLNIKAFISVIDIYSSIFKYRKNIT